jgi:hypothetical protein
MSESTTTKNFLKIDPAIPGQDWVVLAFVSPEELAKKKELYYVDHFLHEEVNEYVKATSIHMSRDLNAKLFKAFDQKVQKLRDSIRQEDKVLANQLDEIRKDIQIDEDKFASECLHQHYQDLDSVLAKYSDYKIRKSPKLEPIFAAQNQNRCSTRGIKVTGCFPTKDEAEERAKYLGEEVEPHVEHYVAQSFYWLPYNPDPNAVKDSRHLNEQLNDLMREKNEAARQADKHFEERKREMVEKANQETAIKKANQEEVFESAKARNAELKRRLREKYRKK